MGFQARPKSLLGSHQAGGWAAWNPQLDSLRTVVGRELKSTELDGNTVGF